MEIVRGQSQGKSIRSYLKNKLKQKGREMWLISDIMLAELAKGLSMNSNTHPKHTQREFVHM
jgi:hypothetical protein